MTDYQIQAPTRRCSASGRELRPGERYYTALLEEDDRLIRQDFASEAWQGPPARAFSFWSGRVSESTDPVKPRFDDDVLEECFQRLEGQSEPSRVNFRYVVALLLIRRKRFRFEETIDEHGIEQLEISNIRTGEKHRVVNPQLTDDQMAEVQNEVFRVLGWN